MSDDFFDELLSDPFDNEGGNMPDDVALVYTSFVWQAGKYEWENDTRQYFSFASQEDMRVKKEECAKHIKENKLGGFPKLGILIEIPIDTFLTAHENMTFDLRQFTNSYFSAKYQTGENGKLEPDQQEKVKGLLPYDLVVKSVNEFRQCLQGPVWARLGQEINWYTEALELRKNDDYPNRLYVIKDIFKDREEAYAAAGVSPDKDEFTDFGGKVPNQLSDLAIRAGWTIETLQAQSIPILDAIRDAVETGKGTPDNKPMLLPQARKFVCDNFVIELTDLDLLNKDEIPF
jgi:hypothetical protein